MGDGTILLVDDEPELLEVCREALEDDGHAVLTAGDGAAALAALRSRPVSLIVTDLNMPGIGGMELLREIAASGLETDVIVLTGYGTVENAVECVRLGAADYLLKPFDVTVLLGRIRNALDERRARRERHRIGALSGLLGVSEELTRHSDPKTMTKAFLESLLARFAPDGLALYSLVGHSRPVARVIWGNGLKRSTARVDAFADELTGLLASGRPALISHMLLNGMSERPLGRLIAREKFCGLSAPIARLLDGSGAVVLLREAGKPPFTVADAQFLALLCSHAATAYEALRARRKVRNVTMELVTSYARAVEAKDPSTHGHSERVSRYAVNLGRKLGLSANELRLLAIAGMLHDIGKIGVPDSILKKPSALTPEEFDIIRSHPVVGRDILSRVEALDQVLPIVYHHHEWVCGEGYPDGLYGSSIPLLARIVSVVDGYEALTSERSYHQALPREGAVRILQEGAGHQWDAELVEAWLGLLRAGGHDISPEGGKGRPDAGADLSAGFTA